MGKTRLTACAAGMHICNREVVTNMNEKIRLGILGIGNMGSAHALHVVEGKCPDFELAAVADVKAERLEWAKTTLPETVRRFDSADAMLEAARSMPA